MNIQHHLKSLILAGTLAVSVGAIQAAVAESYSDFQNYKVVNVANWDALNVRSGAGTNYRVINKIPANTSGIKITSEKEGVNGQNWVKIKWGNQIGWVNMHYLTIAQIAPKPTPTPIAPSTSTALNYVANINTSGNIYEGSAVKTNKAPSQHTHPANECTRSISHNHLSNNANHSHRYSCKSNGKGRQKPQAVAQNSILPPISNMKQTYYKGGNNNYKVKTAVQTNNTLTHRHPANRCTASISHTHASNNPNHSHSYNCQNKGRQQQATVQPTYYGRANLQHTHPKSQCVSAISHSHNGGTTVHRHQCPASINKPTTGGQHTHPGNAMTNSTTHTHPYQDINHAHKYGR